LRTLGESFLRAFQVAVVIWRYFLLPALIPSRQKMPGPIRLRTAFEELSGTWVKLGQALALRFDLLPPDYCYELFKLLNNIPPFPYADVRRIIREELGEYPESLFRSFEPIPFAAASIGQVHRGELHSGQRVAIKIQRPHIRRLIAIDLRLMFFFAGIVDRFIFYGSSSSREVVDEFAGWTEEELDYRVEAHHALILAQNARGDRYEKNAKTFDRFTSRRVLTTELIEGIPLIEILYALGRKDIAYLNHLQEQGYDLYRIAQHIDWNMLNQIHVDGYFHADLHPANLFVLPGNVIAYVDFGIVGHMPDEVRESMTMYSWYFFQGNADRAVEQLLRWVTPTAQSDKDWVRQELTRIIEDFLFTLDKRKEASRKEFSSVFFIDVMNTIRLNRMVLSPSVVAYVKTLLSADTLRFELAPGYDMLLHGRQFFGKMMLEQFEQLQNPDQIVRYAFDYGFRAVRSLNRLESGDLGQEVMQSLFQGIMARVGQRVQNLGLLALIVGLGLVLFFAFPALRLVSVPIILAGVLIVLVIGIVNEGTQLRRNSRPVRRARGALRRRWENTTNEDRPVFRS
jgi:ubiquinone biosynthesis protein